MAERVGFEPTVPLGTSAGSWPSGHRLSEPETAGPGGKAGAARVCLCWQIGRFASLPIRVLRGASTGGTGDPPWGEPDRTTAVDRLSGRLSRFGSGAGQSRLLRRFGRPGVCSQISSARNLAAGLKVYLARSLDGQFIVHRLCLETGSWLPQFPCLRERIPCSWSQGIRR